MNFISRLEYFEQHIDQFQADFQSLKQLIEIQDTHSVLNKIRYITEGILFSLCKEHEISWGRGSPTLERMIGPLRASKVLPAPIFAHFRTIQNLTNPGSHFQEMQLDNSHTSIAQLSLLEVLEWYAKQQHPPLMEANPKKNTPPPTASNHRRRLVFGIILITGMVCAYLWSISDNSNFTDKKRLRAPDLLQRYSRNTSERHFKMIQLMQLLNADSTTSLFEEQWRKYQDILERYNLNRGVYRMDIQYVFGKEMFLWEREVHMELLYAGRNLECLKNKRGEKAILLSNVTTHLNNANGGYQQFILTANQLIDDEINYPLPRTREKEDLDQTLAKPCQP